MASDAGLRHQLALSRQQCAELQQTVTDLTQKMEEVCGDMMVRYERRQSGPTPHDHLPTENQATERRHLFAELHDISDITDRTIVATGYVTVMRCCPHTSACNAMIDRQVLRRDAVRQRCPVRGDSGESAGENKEDMVHKMEQLQDQVSRVCGTHSTGRHCGW